MECHALPTLGRNQSMFEVDMQEDMKSESLLASQELPTVQSDTSKEMDASTKSTGSSTGRSTSRSE